MKKIVSLVLALLLISLPSYNILAEEEVAEYLDNIVVQNGGEVIDLGFDSSVELYEVTVPYSLTEITLQPVLLEVWDRELDHIAIEVALDSNPPVEVLEEQTVDIQLPVGTTEVTVTVIDDEDPIDTLGEEDVVQVFTIQILRQGILEEIEVYVDDVSVGMMPEFDGQTISYTVPISSIITSVEIVPTMGELPNEMIGKVEISYKDEEPVELGEEEGFDIDSFDYGSNLVTIEVYTAIESETPVYELQGTYDIDLVQSPLSSIELSDGFTTIPLDPSFVSITYEYDARVHPEAEEVQYEFEFYSDSDDSVIKVNGEAYSQETLYFVEQGRTDFVIDIYEDILAVEPIATYEVHVLRPVPLLDLSIEPIEAFEFDPLDRNYNLNVAYDVDTITLAPIAPEGVKVTINGEDVSLAPETLVQELLEGQNHIELATELEGAIYTYKIKVFRAFDKAVNQDPKQRRTRYQFEELLGVGEENGQLFFGEGAYYQVVQAFKYGSNSDNQIYVELDTSLEEAQLTIDYSIFKYLVQHKVIIVIMDSDKRVYELSLKGLNLNAHIKGPNDVTNVIVTFEVDEDEVQVVILLDEKTINPSSNRLDVEQEDKPGNSGKDNNGKKKIK